MAPEHRWMTTAEVADELGVSRSTVRRWLRQRKLEGRRIGRQWLIPQPRDAELTVAEVAELVRAHPDTVRRWLAEGRLPGHRDGNQWVVPQEKVIAMVEGTSATGYEISPN